VSGRSFGLIVDRVARILKLASAQVAVAAPADGALTTVVDSASGTRVHLIDAERVLRGPVPPPAAKESDEP
jgi:chemotaxis signal transduction protein